MCVNRKTFEWWSLLGFGGKQNSLCWICLDLRWFQTNVSFHIHSLDLSSRFWIKWMDLDIGGLGTTYQDECVKRSKTPWTPVGFAAVPSPHCGTHLPQGTSLLKMHSTSCAFISSDSESHSEWSSFCSHVVHNSCKNMISAVSTSKGGIQACVWKDLLRDQSVSHFTTGDSIFDHGGSKEPNATFQFPAL